MSRAPIRKAKIEDQLAEGPTSFSARLALLGTTRLPEPSDLGVLDPVLERIKAAAATDPTMIELRELILKGFPNDKCGLSLTMRPYWCVRERLAIDESDGMIVVGSRIVVPKTMRQSIIQDLLEMHQGATKLRQRARSSIYWPNMDVDISNAAGTCITCTKELPSHQPEPLQQRQPATRPFEQIHTDLCEMNGRHFLVLVDQFSGWPHVVPFENTNTTTKKVVDGIRAFFMNVGAPTKLWSDGGPQFTSSEFRDFLERWGVNQGTSSPHYPQSNGRAEAEVKCMKKLIAGSWTSGSFDIEKFAKAMLLFRNIPRAGGASPARLVFNRPVRDSLPAHRRTFAQQWQKEARVLEERAMSTKEKGIEYYNRKARPLPELVLGNHVIIQHPVTRRWSTPGTIVEIGPNREYIVKTEAGRLFRRNRRFLRRRIPVISGGEGEQVGPEPLEPPEPPATEPRRGTRERRKPNQYIANDWRKEKKKRHVMTS